ncbi:MAG: hypothetical protein GX489_03650 [Firmicutes bacterium]|jgi:hypothetical protein|nr:hypothetical protein [Bacillota bacterium]
MIVVNFAHPLTEQHLRHIENLTKQKIEQVYSLPCHFNLDRSLVPQIRSLIDQVPLSQEDWQIQPIIVNLPSLNYGAAVLLAELHGRIGYFPACLRLQPVEGSVPPRFEVVEILNLQAVRDSARLQRFK